MPIALQLSWDTVGPGVQKAPDMTLIAEHLMKRHGPH